MYLWVVIATFITIIYSYNLPVRADLDRVHAESRAGVVVTKFFAQHNTRFIAIFNIWERIYRYT